MAIPALPLTEFEILQMLAVLPSTHDLATAPGSYRTEFARAFARVYGPGKSPRSILQRKFFIPDTTAYSRDQFLQSAAELSVANHVCLAAVARVEAEHPMNPPGTTDVDVFYGVKGIRVGLEVKCPAERDAAPNIGRILTYGRASDREAHDRVNVVVLSNLRYFHTDARAYHDWTLKNVFLLPVVNPYASGRPTGDTRRIGLSIFEHHLKEFTAYRPPCADPRVDREALEATKVGAYVHGSLSDPDYARFFPSTQRRR